MMETMGNEIQSPFIRKWNLNFMKEHMLNVLHNNVQVKIVTKM